MSAQGEMFAPRRRAADRERAAFIKRRLSVGDAVTALGLDACDLGVVSPCCDAIGALNISASGETASCRAGAGGCGTTFDVISLVQRARECGFNAACKFLEEQVRPARRCAATRDLFGGVR